MAEEIWQMCGQLIRTWEGLRKPCQRQIGHPGGCNPFSDTAPPEEVHKLERELAKQSPYFKKREE